LPAKVGRRKLFLWSLAAIWVIDIFITAGSAVFAKDNTIKAAAYTVVAFLYLFSLATSASISLRFFFIVYKLRDCRSSILFSSIL